MGRTGSGVESRDNSIRIHFTFQGEARKETLKTDGKPMLPTPAFCARQMGHSVEQFLNTYAKWIDGGRNDVEMAKLEAMIAPKARKKGAA